MNVSERFMEHCDYIYSESIRNLAIFSSMFSCFEIISFVMKTKK